MKQLALEGGFIRRMLVHCYKVVHSRLLFPVYLGVALLSTRYENPALAGLNLFLVEATCRQGDGLKVGQKFLVDKTHRP
eukprot:2262555-Rhodomonas_salina.1